MIKLLHLTGGGFAVGRAFIWDSYLWNEVTPMPIQRDRPSCVGFDISVSIEEVRSYYFSYTFNKDWPTCHDTFREMRKMTSL